MRDDNAVRATSQMNIPADSAQDPINPTRPNPSVSSIAPPSARVGDLVMRAMVFFESNREQAWRCLRA
jgi:hypothetical protein